MRSQCNASMQMNSRGSVTRTMSNHEDAGANFQSNRINSMVSHVDYSPSDKKPIARFSISGSTEVDFRDRSSNSRRQSFRILRTFWNWGDEAPNVLSALLRFTEIYASMSDLTNIPEEEVLNLTCAISSL